MRCTFIGAGAMAALPALTLIACTQPASESRVNLSGFPPAFHQGYMEGCESAGTRHMHRDEGRYRKDENYMQGWNDGYSICQRR